MFRSKKYCLIFFGALAALLLVFLVSLGLGRVQVPPVYVAKILLGQIFPIVPDWLEDWELVVLTVRLPRLVAATLVGGGLAMAGGCYQTVFRNSLVSPDILGASNGAGLGAALALLYGLSGQMVQAAAFFGSILAVGLTYFIAKIYRRESAMILVLSGIIVSSFFSSGLAFVKSVADTEDVLPAITYWLMGSLANTFFRHLQPVILPMLVSFGALLAVSWKLNVLALHESEAKSLGVNLFRMRVVVILFATLLTASCVCIAGTIGWVGLVIPHISRLLVGADSRKMLPVSLLLGGIFMILVDTLARTITYYEVSLGILTGLVGAPVFAVLLLRERTRLN